MKASPDKEPEGRTPSGTTPITVLLVAAIALAVVGVLSVTLMSNRLSGERASIGKLARVWRDIELERADSELAGGRTTVEETRIKDFQALLSKSLEMPWLQALRRTNRNLEEKCRVIHLGVGRLVLESGNEWPGFRTDARQVDEDLDALANWIADYRIRQQRSVWVIMASLLGSMVLGGVLMIRAEVRARAVRLRLHRDQALAFLEAQEIERRRISRELHDHVAQDLAAIRYECATLFDGLCGIPEDRRQRADRLSGVVAGALRSLRRIAYDLRSSDFGRRDLAASLNQLCAHHAQGGAPEITFHSGGLEGVLLAPVIEANLKGIASEALVNACRHSRSTAVDVSLDASGSQLVLGISDNGVGFDPEQARSQASDRGCMGLLGMRERAALLGARLDLTSTTFGTRVNVTLDLNLAESLHATSEKSIADRRPQVDAGRVEIHDPAGPRILGGGGGAGCGGGAPGRLAVETRHRDPGYLAAGQERVGPA